MRRSLHRAVGFVAAIGFIIGVLAGSPTVAGASPPGAWALDPSFGGDGTVTTRFPGSPSTADWAEDVVVQPDGRIVVAGGHHDFGDGPDSVAVARYVPNGDLDPSFGEVGRFQLFTPTDDAYALALQRIGDETKILVLARSYEAGQEPPHVAHVVRLNPDGSLDTDHDADPAVHLDHDGIATFTFREGIGVGAMTVDSRNRIVIAGWGSSRWEGPPPAMVVRLGPDGRLDRSFGRGGKVFLTPRGRSGGYEDITMAPGVDGQDRIVLAGHVDARDGNRWLITRLQPDGSVDRGFGDRGHAIFALRTEGQARGYGRGVAVDEYGRVTVVGTYRLSVVGNTFDVPAMVRLQPDGHFDPTFGGNGKVRLGTDRLSSREAVDVVLGPDGTAYWVGTRSWPTGGQDEWVLVGGRQPDGSKDHRFGPEGSMAVSFGPVADRGASITLDSRERLVLTGVAGLPGGVHASFGVARLNLP